ncbi:replication initiation protein [Thiothrix fructosivorans]|uniref:Replication initiation protein n=1 Tax=Thiothrix fructosivorans TaxID=111770 RepID=A0A8B0SVF3_9GAMM|nr:replication initiation protein [Thiothrix fructosivorans]MBO0611330.1 replication initiation protein [Thiothrix fructosivorans]QTX12942.1 replication initiation protein [Thiothrix fructosivorans]
MNLKTINTPPLDVIRKSNKLIEARYRLSVWEQRLILTLLINISKQDEDFKRYRIRVADFASQWQLESDNSLYEKVHEAADSLVGRTLQISDDPTISKTVSWLAYVEYVRGSGVVELEFHNALKPYLLQLKKHYTEYQLGHVVNFKNQYTIRIYELLKMEVFRYKSVGKFSKDFKYEDLRVLLAISKKEYLLFGDFKKRIIAPSVDEISTHTDLEITEVRYGKTGRKVTDITFCVTIRTADELPTLQLEMEEEPPKEQVHPIVERLISLGFAVETASKYKTRYGVKRIERNIAYTLAKQQEGVVKDIPAYLNMAIKEDMGGGWEVVKTKAAEEKTQQQTVSHKREEQAELAHLQKMADMAGVPLETLLPKKGKGGN